MDGKASSWLRDGIIYRWGGPAKLKPPKHAAKGLAGLGVHSPPLNRHEQCPTDPKQQRVKSPSSSRMENGIRFPSVPSVLPP